MPIDFPSSPTTGQLYQSGDKTWRYDGEKWTIYATIVVVDSTPVGSLQAYAGTTAPTGWMMAFGQAISRTTFSGLFNVIGTTYGVGDGSTTFNLPDLRGRVPAGLDNMGGSAANRLTATVLTSANTLGATGGAQTHLLSSLESGVRGHIHDNTATFTGTASTTGAMNSNQSHNHMTNDNHPWAAPGPSGFKYSVVTSTQNGATPTSSTNIDHTHNFTPSGTVTMNNGSTSSANATNAHNNTQPTIVMNYIIKYGPSAVINGADDEIIIPTQIFS